MKLQRSQKFVSCNARFLFWRSYSTLNRLSFRNDWNTQGTKVSAHDISTRILNRIFWVRWYRIVCGNGNNVQKLSGLNTKSSLTMEQSLFWCHIIPCQWYIFTFVTQIVTLGTASASVCFNPVFDVTLSRYGGKYDTASPPPWIPTLWIQHVVYCVRILSYTEAIHSIHLSEHLLYAE
jgi:hypothetical protein